MFNVTLEGFDDFDNRLWKNSIYQIEYKLRKWPKDKLPALIFDESTFSFCKNENDNRPIKDLLEIFENIDV